MNTHVALVLALSTAVAGGCGKRSYTVTVSEPAIPPAVARAQATEPLDRLRESAERLRDRAARGTRQAARSGVASLAGTNPQRESTSGTSGMEKEETLSAARGEAGGTAPGNAPDSARSDAPPAQPEPTSGDSQGFAFDTVAAIVLLGAIAVAIAAVMLARRRRAV